LSFWTTYFIEFTFTFKEFSCVYFEQTAQALDKDLIRSPCHINLKKILYYPSFFPVSKQRWQIGKGGFSGMRPSHK